MAHDLKAPERPMWCEACRSTGAFHCAHPDECGNMLSAAGAADNWKAWLDDIPLNSIFDPAICRLQDFISALVARIATLEAALADMMQQRDKWEAAHDDLVAEIARLTSEVTQLRADDQVIVNEWIRDLAEQEKADG